MILNQPSACEADMSMSMLARQAANDHGNHAAITHDDRACSDNARGRSIVDLESVLEATMLRNAYGMLRAQEACASSTAPACTAAPSASRMRRSRRSSPQRGRHGWEDLGAGKTWPWEDLALGRFGSKIVFYFSTLGCRRRGLVGLVD